MLTRAGKRKRKDDVQYQTVWASSATGTNQEQRWGPGWSLFSTREDLHNEKTSSGTHSSVRVYCRMSNKHVGQRQVTWWSANRMEGVDDAGRLISDGQSVWKSSRRYMVIRGRWGSHSSGRLLVRLLVEQMVHSYIRCSDESASHVQYVVVYWKICQYFIKINRRKLWCILITFVKFQENALSGIWDFNF